MDTTSYGMNDCFILANVFAITSSDQLRFFACLLALAGGRRQAWYIVIIGYSGELRDRVFRSELLILDRRLDRSQLGPGGG